MTVVFGELACWWGGLMGLVGLGVSKMEGIKASVVWVSSRTQAMSWCFRCVSAVFSACFGVALHGARADRLRFGHLASSMRRAGARVGLSPGRARAGHSRAREHRRGRGLAPPTRVQCRSEGWGLIIRDEAGLEGGSPVDGWNPRHPRPSLPRRPGLDQPRIPPSTPENRPTHNRHNLQKHKRTHE